MFKILNTVPKIEGHNRTLEGKRFVWIGSMQYALRVALRIS